MVEGKKEGKGKKKRFKGLFKGEKDEIRKSDFIKELKVAYRSIEDKGRYVKTILLPLVSLGVIVFLMPFILERFVSVPLDFNPATFIIGGVVPILLGVFYPYISWKNRENDINSRMHFMITHLRVLAISDLSLKDIINMLGGKKVYGSLGEELKRASVLSTQWKVPLARAFRFVSERTPSKILRDFLDRFSQSLISGVGHREFIEQEQGAVLEEYKTMYESSNENITILNEVYVSLLIAITFIMSFGLVMPMIVGSADINTFVYLASFMMIVTEGLLLYLLRSMIPADEIWPQTGERGDLENGLYNLFKVSLMACVVIGVVFFVAKSLSFMQFIPFEVAVALTLTPLLLPGVKTYMEEENISRMERNFLGFLPALGSIAAMRGGKINESVHYLSEKDYGILTRHIKALYRRLRTRIDDDAAWEWFGVDTGSNYIQRASEMFREATYAAANPRDVAHMITENIRKLRDLRVKKQVIVKTTASLFGGITFGVAFCVYVSLLIAKHLNDIWLETGDPFNELQYIDIGSILTTIPPQVFANIFVIVFFVLVVHSFIMAFTIRVLRGSHVLLTFLYFVPFVWTVAVTAVGVNLGLGSYLGM
ncbi:MAG TPA: archaellar assembly protein FlaJ [Thermoplasmatales archaeon]|nr:archaellar assembly protein FlaJ [Thermoplasmatales archaeon]